MAQRKLGLSDIKISWQELIKTLKDEGFAVDHFHGILETKTEDGILRKDIVHINIDGDEVGMSSILIGVDDLLPGDFDSLRADEWHEH